MRPATIIEDTVLDLRALEERNAFEDIIQYPQSQRPLSSTSLNAFAALPRGVRKMVRERIQDIWTQDALRSKYEDAMLPAASVTNHVPMETINYTDYVSSRGHFENVSIAL